MPDVYLCHCDADKAYAEELVHRLRTEGYSIWYAPVDLLVGQDMVDAAFDGIRNSPLCVLLWTKNSSRSQRVRLELNTAYLDSMRDLDTEILVLRADNTPGSPLVNTFDSVDCRDSIGLALAAISDKFASLGRPRSNHGNQTEAEKAVERLDSEIWRNINDAITLERNKDGELVLRADEKRQDIEVLRRKVDRCLNLVDHLCSIQDNDNYALICSYSELGNNLAVAVSDYSRQAQYIEMLYARTVPCVDNLILRGICNACAKLEKRAAQSLSEAMLLYAQLAGSFDPMDILRLVFRVTRHVRMAYTGSYAMASNFVLTSKQGRIKRLDTALQSLDSAISNLLDFSKGSDNLIYGSTLWTVGLTRHAEPFLDRARDLGEPADRVYPNTTRKLRTLLQHTTSSESLDLDDLYRDGPNGSLECRFPLTSLQTCNFAFQFGIFLDPTFDDLVETEAPSLHADVHRHDDLFRQGVEHETPDEGTD